MERQQKSRSKKQNILLAKIDTKWNGLDCYAGMDLDAVKLLNGRQAIESQISVKGRTLSQNSLWAVWYNQISKTLQEDTPLGVKNFCKLHFGVPILRAENIEFREVYDRCIKPIEYEEKLKFMRFMSVTSLFNKFQGMRYQEDVQKHYSEVVRLEIL